MSINLFIDTSSIFCLYHYESGTNEMEEIFHKQKIRKIFRDTTGERIIKR